MTTKIDTQANAYALLLAIEALHDVLEAATGGINGRNVTSDTRRAECAIIAASAIHSLDILARDDF
jgi:hypothetical protein